MKFYIYIHTHWDREWYFTNGTSQVLLKNNINFYLQNPTLKHFYLDGQVSLVEDYLKVVNKKNAKNFLKLIKERKIITGPWFTQPDLFNALGETTIRNLELAKFIAKQHNIPLSSVMYAPDTFGFPINFPQLLRKFNFTKMIFWRGLNHTIKNDHFLWIGINNYKVNCYNLKFGYFFLGHLINWSKLTEENLYEEANLFVKKFMNSQEYKHFKQQNKKIILIGSGHDQAPPYVLIEKFFALVNKFSTDTFIIKNYEDYFENTENETLPIYYEALDYATNSKIHRTISSSRYTLKKIFRDVEHLLYHQLEPLQLAIKSSNPFYDNHQSIFWQKKLVKLQAHDALGGCVSDEVYIETWVKLNDLKNQILSEKDYILKQIGNQKNLSEDEFLIFNPNISSSNNSIVNQEITLKQKYNLFKETINYAVYIIYNSENKLIKNGFLHHVIVVNKNLKPFDLVKLSLSELEKIDDISNNSLENWDKFKLIIEDDLGDTYDFDPNLKKQQIILSKKETNIFVYNNLKISTTNYLEPQNNQKFIIQIFQYEDKEIIKIKTLNKLKNSRVSLLINENENFEQIKYQQLLSLIKIHTDSQENWTEFYKEKPVNNYRTTGVIVGSKQIIQTFGTNEFYLIDNKIAVVLYRTVDKLGKANLNHRPGPVSGLDSKIIYTPLAQYKDIDLEFNFKRNKTSNLDINDVANNFLRTPMFYHHKSVDVESNKLGQFIFEPNNYFNLDFKAPVIPKNIFVSSSWINFESKIQNTVVDLNINEMKIIKNEK